MSIKNRFRAIHKAANKRYKKPGRIIIYDEDEARPGYFSASCNLKELVEGTHTQAELENMLDLSADDTIIIMHYSTLPPD